jgi:hypothetical protein
MRNNRTMKTAENQQWTKLTNHAEQKNEGNGQKSVREQNHAQGNKSSEQTNKGNVGFLIRNSPTSEADQNFDQFISSPRLKHCTKRLNEPAEFEKVWRTCVQTQNNGTGVPFSETGENKTNGPMRESPLKIPSTKWEIGSVRALGKRTRVHRVRRKP